MGQPLRLRGISGDLKGKVWESESLLRAGRLGTLEIVLDDSSVDRRHAEVRYVDSGWWVRDLDSTSGVYVNGVRLGNGERQLHSRDIVQFGQVALMVEIVESTETANGPSSDQNHLLRAGQHLVATESEDELLHSILNDAVSALNAQRGAIVLADAADGSLRLRAFASRAGEAPGRFSFYKKLAERVFSQGESIVAKLNGEVGSADGAMASVLCVPLRTPRKRLGVLHLDRSHPQNAFNRDDLQRADALAANVSAAIECASLERQQRDLFLKTITLLAQSVKVRDAYTGAHCARVTNYSLLLAQKLDLPPKDIDLIRIGATLHDLGKTAIGDEILRKPGKLSEAEYETMKTHSAKGAEIISTIPDLHPVVPIVRSHHERWDGRGYPDKLKGDAIPQLARIVAVADAFDAMTSDAPYHPEGKGRPPQEAFEELRQMAGTQFDPEYISAFLELQTEIEEMMNRAAAPGSA